MRKSKLFNILRTFKAEDWGNFNRYLGSQLNTKSDPYRLYVHIEKYKERLKHERLDADKTNQQLFPDKNAKSFRNILSRLNSYLTDYIAIDQYLHDPRQRSLMLVEGLNRRGLFDMAVKQSQKLKTQLDGDGINLWTPWYRHRLLHQMKYSENPQKNGRNSYLLHEIMDSYQLMDSRFKSFYQLDTCLIEQVEPDELLTETREWVSHIPGQLSDPFISLFDALIELYRNPSEVLFNRIFTQTQKETIAEVELIVVYVHLRRYLIKRIYEGSEYVQRYADLTLWALRKGFLLDEQKVDPLRFGNAVIVLNAANRWTDTEAIINKYGRNLPSEHVNLAQANLYSYKGEYLKALDKLYKPEDLSLSIRVTYKRLILINLFAIHYANYDFINNQLVNFQSFINRAYKKGEIGPNIYNGNKIMIKVLKSIVKKEITREDQFVKELKSFSGRLLITRISKNCGLID